MRHARRRRDRLREQVQQCSYGPGDGGVEPFAGFATDTPLAVTGAVPVKVVGLVARGDLLTTSPTPGHAMACTDPALCFGAVIGKALEGHLGGAGTVRAMIGLG